MLSVDPSANIVDLLVMNPPRKLDVVVDCRFAEESKTLVTLQALVEVVTENE